MLGIERLKQVARQPREALVMAMRHRRTVHDAADSIGQVGLQVMYNSAHEAMPFRPGSIVQLPFQQ